MGIRTENIIIHLILRGEARNLKSFNALWHWFFGNDILEILVTDINKLILAGDSPTSNRTACLTGEIEIKALIGLL